MLIWCRGNWGRIFTAGGVYSALLAAAAVVRLRIPAASGRLQTHSILYLDHPLQAFWQNYWEDQSPAFLFEAPLELPLQHVPGLAHINHHLLVLYALGLAALAAAVVVPGRLLRLLDRPASADEVREWRRSALWVLAWLALGPIAGALFRQHLYTARLTHLLVGVLLVIALGCATLWHLLRRLPLRAAAPAFAWVLAAYLGEQIWHTGRAFVRADPYFKDYLQYGVPEVMRYLAQQPKIKTVQFPPLEQGYIYHLLYTPVPPAKLNRAEVSPPLPKAGEPWHYASVPKVGNYFFDEILDRDWVARHATLRHQVRDRDRVWFDLYERDGNWFVLRHDTVPQACGEASTKTNSPLESVLR